MRNVASGTDPDQSGTPVAGDLATEGLQRGGIRHRSANGGPCSPHGGRYEEHQRPAPRLASGQRAISVLLTAPRADLAREAVDQRRRRPRRR